MVRTQATWRAASGNPWVAVGNELCGATWGITHAMPRITFCRRGKVTMELGVRWRVGAHGRGSIHQGVWDPLPNVRLPSVAVPRKPLSVSKHVWG